MSNTEAKFRYPGAQPFATSEENIFFGRERDIDALYRKVSMKNMVVLFAKSGLGKSSLLEAGLVPKLVQNDTTDVIKVRFNAFVKDSEENVTPVQKTYSRLAEALKVKERESFVEQLLPKEDTLWYLMKQAQTQPGHKREYVLIFDQFEELFTYPAAQVDVFKYQLAEVLKTQFPKHVQSIVEKEVANPGLLSTQQLDLLHKMPTVRVVIAIRSDRISLLDRLAGALPVKENWYELAALSEQQAEEAITNPAFEEGDFESHIFGYNSDAIEKVLNFLTKEKQEDIESFQLQILCQAIEKKVIREQLKIIREDDLGNIEKIYENYYEDQIQLLKDTEEQLAARKLIEEGLIFAEEERRIPLFEGQIYKQYAISTDLLRRLENTHLIRREVSLKGGYTYELSHDTLVAPVLKAKERRLAEEKIEKERKEKAERERKLKEIQEQAEKERELREAAEWNLKLANDQKTLAEKARKDAEAAKEDAENQKLLAENAQQTAIEQAQKAEKEKGKAQKRTWFAIAFALAAIVLAIYAYNAADRAKAAESDAKYQYDKLVEEQQAKEALQIQTLILEAESFIKSKEYDLAKAPLEDAIKIDPDNAEVQEKMKFVNEQLDK